MRERSLTSHALAKQLPTGPDRVTIDRILKWPDHKPQRASLEKLEIFFGERGKLTELIALPAVPEAHHLQRDLTGIWYELIPKQPRRSYESVDRVTIKRDRRGEVRGRIERLHSTRRPADVGEQWETMGVVREDRLLYFVFYSVSDVRYDSNGAIALRRGRSYRQLEGYYLRFRPGDSKESAAPAFTIAWHRDPAAIVNSSSWSGENV